MIIAFTQNRLVSCPRLLHTLSGLTIQLPSADFGLVTEPNVPPNVQAPDWPHLEVAVAQKDTIATAEQAVAKLTWQRRFVTFFRSTTQIFSCAARPTNAGS